MRRPSRQMPKLSPPKSGLLGWFILGAFCLWLLWLVFAGVRSNPVAAAIGLLAAATYAYFSTRHSRARPARLRALAAERAGESICEFARSFDPRETDTWVIRAVYEQLQTYLTPVQNNFQIQSTDLLLGQLIDDPDDLDMDLVEQVATRTGRLLKDATRNRYYGRVNTVADLVHFFNAQPVKSAT